MMDAIQRAVPVPQAEVIMHGASGRQILGQRAPLAAGAQNVHHAVDHLADMRTSATDAKSVPTWLQGKPTVNPTNPESEFAMQ